jgi:hypothetical protein
MIQGALLRSSQKVDDHLEIGRLYVTRRTEMNKNLSDGGTGLLKYDK